MPSKKNFTDDEIRNIINDYVNDIRIYDMCKKYKIGKLRLHEILTENKIQKRENLNIQIKNNNNSVNEKYVENDEVMYIVYDEENPNFITSDVHNKSGVITKYIQGKYNVELPSVYKRNKHFLKTGNYWWEEYLKIKEVKSKELRFINNSSEITNLENVEYAKKCPYCEWYTLDVENKSGAFLQHLKNIHDVDLNQYLSEFPDEREFFKYANQTLDLQYETDPNKFVVCKICGRKLTKIDNSHLKNHGITQREYIAKYGSDELVCKELHDKLSKSTTLFNMNYIPKKHSKAENEINDFINKLGFETCCDRKILEGQEIDIYIQSLQIGFEYNGCFWHSEEGGKDKMYHLNKTKQCELKNVRLYHIFDDEYTSHKDVVLYNIKRILQVHDGKIVKNDFIIDSLDYNEKIQSFIDANSLHYCKKEHKILGLLYQSEIIGILLYNIDNDILYASDIIVNIEYDYDNIVSLLIDYLTNMKNISSIKILLDRCLNSVNDNNIYRQLNFNITNVTESNYLLYNRFYDKFKRYYIDEVKNLDIFSKFSKVWDCGKVEYTLKTKENEKVND